MTNDQIRMTKEFSITNIQKAFAGILVTKIFGHFLVIEKLGIGN